MNDAHTAAMIAVIALVTALLRFLPFWIFGENRKTPALITYLGKVLPYAIMGMLVVYCLKDVDLIHAPFGIPELLGCVVVALLEAKYPAEYRRRHRLLYAAHSIDLRGK